MVSIRCSFRGGEVEAKTNRFSMLGQEGLAKGNSWRGALLLLGIVMLFLGQFIPGAIVLVSVGLWSFISMAIKNWQQLYRRAQASGLLKRGKWEEALHRAGPLAPGSKFWWQFVGVFFARSYWDLARKWLEELGPGEERDYFLAIALLGQREPKAALHYCPPRPRGKWQTVTAEAYFQQGKWKTVLEGLRSPGDGKDKLEHAWLRGVSYYYLKEYKAAVKLLGRVVDLGGKDYGNANQLFESALARLK